MPRLAQYDAPDLSLRPSEIGISAVSGAARRLQGNFNEAAAAQEEAGRRLGSAVRDAGGAAVLFAEHQEISNGSARFAELQDNLTKSWNDTAKNANPNDPTVAARWRAEVAEPALEKYGSAFNTTGGQNWAQSHVGSLRQHLFTKSAADMSSLAAQAVAVNAATTVNRLSSTVRQDPSSLDFALKTAESSIAGVVDTSPNMSATDAAKARGALTLHAKEQIVKSWFMGLAEKSPDAARAALESGKYAEFIKGDEGKQIITYARANQRLMEGEARNARLMREHEEKVAFDRAVNDLELSTVPQDANGTPVLPPDYFKRVRDIGQMPGAAQNPGRLKTMVENGERIAARLNKPEPLARVSHETTMGLLQRMRATDESRLTSNDDIYKAYGDGKLSREDFNFLQREFASMRSPEGESLGRARADFFQRYGPMIDTAVAVKPGEDIGGGHTALGKQKLYEAEIAARREESDLRAKGLDPHLAYDPRSEHFFGRPENMAKYRPTLQQELQSRAPAASPGSPPKPVFSPPASWQYSPSRKQYRDPATGTLYDLNGNAIREAAQVPQSR